MSELEREFHHDDHGAVETAKRLLATRDIQTGLMSMGEGEQDKCDMLKPGVR